MNSFAWQGNSLSVPITKVGALLLILGAGGGCSLCLTWAQHSSFPSDSFKQNVFSFFILFSALGKLPEED